jgi:hypothetical protein
MVYGKDLDRLGEDAVPQVWRRHGLWGLVRLVADIAVRLPIEYLGEIRQDAVYAVRVLARSPGFAAVAILSLALGIAMCSAILCGSSSVLRPMPGARDPGALVAARKGVSYPYFEHYRDQQQVAGSATVFLVSVSFAVAQTTDRNARAERFYGHIVSPEYFSTLGVTPAAGRFFSSETERPGMAPVVVVTDRFWRTYLNSDPRAVGRAVRLNGQLATIVGITAPDFLGMWPFNPADLFVPVTCGSALAPELAGDPLHTRDLEMFRMVVRLPHGVSIPAAESALDAMTLALDRQAPDADRDRDPKSRQLRLMPAGTFGLTTPEQRRFVYSFNFVMWVLILSLVCANLANLLLARGSQRRREIALRLSVGASRARLVRQFLTESVLLSLAGGVAGIVAAYWVAHMMTALPLPSSGPLLADFRPDLRIFALTLAASLAAGIGCGLMPALASVRADIGLALKEGGLAASRGFRRFSLRNLFVVAQVAASLMLLLVTGFIVTGYGNFSRIDPGFDTANLASFSLDPVRDGYSTEEAEAFFASLPEQLSRVPGVRAAALAEAVPFGSLLAHGTPARLSTATGDGARPPGLVPGRPRTNRGELLLHLGCAHGKRARVRHPRPAKQRSGGRRHARPDQPIRRARSVWRAEPHWPAHSKRCGQLHRDRRDARCALRMAAGHTGSHRVSAAHGGRDGAQSDAACHRAGARRRRPRAAGCGARRRGVAPSRSHHLQRAYHARESRPDQRIRGVEYGGLFRAGPVLAAARLHRPGRRHGLRGGAKAEGNRHPYGARRARRKCKGWC